MSNFETFIEQLAAISALEEEEVIDLLSNMKKEINDWKLRNSSEVRK